MFGDNQHHWLQQHENFANHIFFSQLETCGWCIYTLPKPRMRLLDKEMLANNDSARVKEATERRTRIKTHCSSYLNSNCPGTRAAEVSMSVSQQAVTPHMWALVLLRVAKERYRRGLGIREPLRYLLACFTDFLAMTVGNCFQYQKNHS